MKVINKKMCVVFVLVLLEISSLFLMYKSNSNKEIKLDNVENKEVINNNMIAIMIEQTNGTYSQYTTTNTWPSDTTYVLNTLKSGCVDNKGNKVENGMSFDKTNRKIIVNTNKTSNCYAYFTRSALYKIQNNSHVWNSDLANDGYRFYGSQDGTLSTVDNVPNYVCFGTQSKSECVSDTDKYMYRIIGAFQDSNNIYHLKLIKKESLNTAYAWHSDNQSNINWSESDLYKGINGNYFLNNPEYYYMQEDFWYSKIANWKWTSSNTQIQFLNSGDGKTTGNTGADYVWSTSTVIYNSEHEIESTTGCSNTSSATLNCKTTASYTYVNSKIGLMYTSDYVLSLGSIAKDYIPGWNKSVLKTGWLFIKNNDSTILSTSKIDPPYGAEWLISIGGYDNSTNIFTAYGILGNSGVQSYTFIALWAVRPAFYLNSDVVICAGTGTSTDPYILG